MAQEIPTTLRTGSPMTRSGTVNPPITRLFEGDVLTVGGYKLRVLQTPGHDLHHLCLYDAENELLVGGDQVLSVPDILQLW